MQETPIHRQTKRQRLEATINGRPADRPPFTFWYHFPKNQVAGQPCAEAHLEHYARHRLDWLKVMNDNGYPAPSEPLASTSDLAHLTPAPLNAPEFQNQLDALNLIQHRLQDQTLWITTLFNPLSVLGKLTGGTVVNLAQKDEGAVHHALSVIARSLAVFADACVRAGAAGIFMSCSDHDLNRALGPGAYERLVAPHDLAVFGRVESAPLNVVHVHKKADDFDLFLTYPVAAINWADRTDGPSIAEVASKTQKVLMAGMDHVGAIVKGRPADVRREIADAVHQAAGHALIVAPGCSFPADAPEENLQAVHAALATGPGMPRGLAP